MFAGLNLHFLDRLLPLLRRVQRRVRQHVALQADGTEGRVALNRAQPANQTARVLYILIPCKTDELKVGLTVDPFSPRLGPKRLQGRGACV